MSISEHTSSPRRRRHDTAQRVSAGAVRQRMPLFTADEHWSRTSGVREATTEKDDYGFLLEPGFWLTILLACVPIAVGCVYLLLTEG
jgi:hypothetical protein